jgi:fumarate reductase flavoprotein subunit
MSSLPQMKFWESLYEKAPVRRYSSMNTKIHKMAVMAFFTALIGVFYACSSLSFQSARPWYMQGKYAPGVYEGTAPGFRGWIRIAVRVDENGIAGIDLDHEDDGEIGGAAMGELLELVLEGNSTDNIDAVTGATESSLGFLAAVDDALSKAAQYP